MYGRGVHSRGAAWWGGVCMTGGGMCGGVHSRRYVWQGVCMAEGGMCGREMGACVAGEMATGNEFLVYG